MVQLLDHLALLLIMIVTFVEAVEFAITRILRVIKTIRDEKKKLFPKRRGKPTASAPTN